MQILLDIDEVLVDFVTGACLAHGISTETMEAYRKPNHWSIVEAVGKALAIDGFGLEQFWKPIHAQGADFWLSLSVLPWADTVIQMVKVYDPNFILVSAPSFCPSSYTGKILWIREYFGQDFDRFILTPHKELLAKPGRVLIDDREENLEKFKTNGGEGILFPSKGGWLYELADNPLPIIKCGLNSLVERGL